MEIIILVWVIILLLLLYLSGYFSSLETAFVALDSLQVKQMVEDKVKNAKIIAKLKKQQHKLLITILIGNNLVNIGASSLATFLTIELFGNAYIGIMTGVLTLLILIFGEITPKTLASAKAQEIAIQKARTINTLMYLFTPIIKLLELTTRGVLNVVGHRDLNLEHEEKISEDTVRRMIAISEKEGEINKQEREMIHNIFEFDDQEAKSIMTPRTEVFGIDMNDEAQENIQKILSHEFSRVPVYNNDLDKVIGILYIKDLIKYLGKDREITKTDIMGMLRKPHVVPGNMKIDRLFNQLKKKRVHMAIVVDEYGGTMGIVTIEDVLEEIVGEIYDETDEKEEDIKKIDKHTYRIDGGTEIEEINKELGTFIPENEDYETISGYVLDQLERMPKEKEELELEDFKIKVDSIRNNRIDKLRLIFK